MNYTVLSYIILGASILSHLLPIIIGKRNNNSLLWTYVLTGFCFEIILTSLKRIFNIDGVDYHLIGSIYFLVEFMFVTFYYYPKVIPTKKYLITITSLFTIIYLLTFYDGTIISGKGAGIFILLFSIYSIIGMYQLLNTKNSIRIERSSFFWVNTGFLIYAAGSLPIFIAVDTLLEVNKETLYSLWIFRNVLNVIKNVIFTKALTLKDSE